MNNILHMPPKPEMKAYAQQCIDLIESLSKDLKSCWFWEIDTKRGLRMERSLFIRNLFTCYDFKPGAVTEIPPHWMG